MAWIRVDDVMPIGPKAKRAALILSGGRSGEAFQRARGRVLAVFVDVMGYCNRCLTDGFIPDHEVAGLADAEPLVVLRAMAKGDAHLGAIVEREPKRRGWVVRNYAEYQPTKAKVEEKLRKDRERKAGKPKNSADSPTGVRADSARNPQSEIADSAAPGPARPVPVDQTQDQDPRAALAQRPVEAVEKSHAPAPRALRMNFVDLVEVQRHLLAAVHGEIDRNPNVGDGELADVAKETAAKLRVSDYSGDRITKLIDAVRGERARRRA